MSLETFLQEIQEAGLAAFRGNEQVKTFDQFLQDFYKNPYLHIRCSPQYVLEMLDHFGTRPVESPGIEATRFKVFDGKPDRSLNFLVGQEKAQTLLYGYIKSFARKGRADKMILIHGPNGSGKSMAVECIFQRLEEFSRTPQGILLKFNWIFLEREGKLGHIGFDHGLEDLSPKKSLADLEEKEIGARIPCELRDPPIFLVPREKRREIIEDAISSCDLPKRPDFNYDFFLEGDLCQKCRRIYDTVLNAYRGDWEKLTQHVQVERYSLSKRYRTGAVSIEPQGNVDAAVRPFSSDEARILPPVLRNTTLFEPMGDIIDANQGVLEYSDFLKRPIETNKYLLTTCERGTVNLPHCLAYLNLLILGTTNEKQLNLFKRNPDFSSFKGRIELIPMPYLLSSSREVEIYQRHIGLYSRDRHVTPHTAEIAALWAILTRLRKPNPRIYSGQLATLVGRLSPLEKAKLIDRKDAPDHFNEEEKKLIRANVQKIREEFEEAEGEFEGIFGSEYEGRRGASAREMMTMLSRAAENRNYDCLTPMAVFGALQELCKETSLYEFLRFPVDDGYHDVQKFLEAVKGEYIRIVTQEVYDSMSLVDEGEYSRIFLEYFRHVKAFCSREKVFNQTTNSYEDASVNLMTSIEKLLNFSESPEEFRSNIMTKIGAKSLEAPRGKINYQELFPGIFQALRENFYKERNRMLTLIEEDILKFGTDDFNLLNREDQAMARDILSRMEANYHYCQHCAKDVIAYVLRNREDR